MSWQKSEGSVTVAVFLKNKKSYLKKAIPFSVVRIGSIYEESRGKYRCRVPLGMTLGFPVDLM
jgi:hypothetical protein